MLATIEQVILANYMPPRPPHGKGARLRVRNETTPQGCDFGGRMRSAFW